MFSITFKFALKKQLSYDLVILDPPSYAKSKDFIFSAEKDYPSLLADAIHITRNTAFSANAYLVSDSYVGSARNTGAAAGDVIGDSAKFDILGLMPRSAARC